MISRPPVMPPTTDPGALLRKAKTNQIQNAFQNQRQPPRVGYLGPPTAQPPGGSIQPMPPLGQTDPLTPGPTFPHASGGPNLIPPVHPPINWGSIGPAPVQPPISDTTPPQFTLGPGPTHQPPIGTGGITPFPYQVFQNALRASGRDFGNPTAMTGGNGPAVAGGIRSVAEGGQPDPTVHGPHDELGIDPGGAGYPGGNNTSNSGGGPYGLGYTENGNPILPQGGDPTAGNFHGSDPGLHPGDLGADPRNWQQMWQDPDYWVNDDDSPYRPPSQTPPMDYAGEDTGDSSPGGSGRGGEGGPGGGGRVWDAGLMRWVLPYGIGHIAHALGGLYRNYRANNTAGPGGRGGGGTGGNRGGIETPSERAFGDRNWNLAGGHNSQYNSPAGSSSFNYGTGQYEQDRAPGVGFRGSPNQGAEQASRSRFHFGMHPAGDAGQRINHLTQEQQLRNQNVDPQTQAFLRAWAAAHTTTRQLYGG